MKLGYNDGISNEAYHSDIEFLSSSSLKLMAKCPREFYKKYVKGEQDEEKRESASLTFGSFLHSIVLEPELVQSEYTTYNGVKRGKAWEEFKASEENVGKTIISSSQESQGAALKSVMEENKFAVDLLQEGEAEKTLCVELDGIKIKVRADYLRDGKVIDLKTTAGGVTYDEVSQTCMKWGYPLSAALYVDAFTKHTGKKHDFYFIFLAKSPMGCEVYKASERMLEYGRKQYKKAIEQIKHARETGIWFNEDVNEICIPEGI